MSRRPWTATEDAVLLAGLAAGHAYSRIGRALGRPDSSIGSRIDALSFREPARLTQALAARKLALGGRSWRRGCPVTAADDPPPPATPKPAIAAPAPGDRATRTCLRCRKDFLSTHAGNRLCAHCRAAVASASSPYAP